MSPETLTTTESPVATAGQRSGVAPHRFTVRQFLKMDDAGIFPEGVHAELLGGIVVTMTKFEPHNFCVTMLAELVRRLVPAGHFLFEEKSVRSGRYWLPEPDVAVVRGELTNFRRKHPQLRDLALAAEVAESSYRSDRGVKWAKYASSGIPVYWIVNLARSRVEVFTQPKGRGKTAVYEKETIYEPAQHVPVVIDGREIGSIAVQEILP